MSGPAIGAATGPGVRQPPGANPTPVREPLAVFSEPMQETMETRCPDRLV